ncbi:MAG: DNA mismatch repair protein MutS [Chloroflexi bacterium]|nr:DNA mismatch repair protein MutS [Chloroflexota bacterium]
MPTPLRQQYLQIKKQFPDTIVFFRLGDFYESFDDDAKKVAAACNIVLTAREMGTDQRVPLAGVPYHALDTYLARLINAGHKVAIVEQTSDEAINGLMTREVVRVVTPGTVVEPNLLEEKRNNYLAALAFDKVRAGIAYADITTGAFAVTEVLANDARQELDRLHPAEVLMEVGNWKVEVGNASTNSNLQLLTSNIKTPDLDSARQTLLEHFRVASLDGFGLNGMPLAIRAAGALVQYLQDHQKSALAQLQSLKTYSTQSFMTLDSATRRNLELTQTIRAGAVKGSLLGVLDETRTAMGGRLLREWLLQPLLDLNALNARQANVDAFFRDTARRERVRDLLKQIADVERLTNRVAQGIALPRDVVGIRVSLEVIPKLLEILHAGEQRSEGAGEKSEIRNPKSEIDECPDILSLLKRAIVPEPPATLANGGVIAPGFSAELDGIASAAKNAKDWVANLERTERERTGIRSLKVGYNKVFGYYIEITTPNLPQAPPEYIRKQTLANAERYITPELKEYESLILNAEERLTELETTLFKEICAQIAGAARRLLATARALAEIDVYATLAEVAMRYRYARPELNDDDELHIVAGRHPVVELALRDDPFVPNDVTLSAGELIHIITGPNMSGKSTFLRQTALIALMAQIGSFVPAESARLGLVDRIFTRIGAQDEIAAGQSTFMVEMVETANILAHSTRKSLIILDEIGRGTSTYDGIAIARAIVEHIHNHPNLGAKTLFATHYHELIELEKYLPRVRNYNVAVLEQGGRVVFLHKIARGGADKSYGIHVAQLAGIPKAVIHRAEQVLLELESRHEMEGPEATSSSQLSFFAQDDALRKELQELDVLSLSPLEALSKLFELVEKAKKSDG